MDNPITFAVAAGHSVDPAVFQAVFGDVEARISGRFARSEPRQAAGDLLRGLLSPVEQKNCWWLAEQAGHERPYRLQRLLRDAVWDENKVGEDLRQFVARTLHHRDAVLVVDETGFLKKGTSSVGVQRQYCGTAGRIENSQVAVFLSYASPHGRALIDRRLYMPRSWTSDPDRCRAAGVPDEVEFATKPHLAWQMIQAALDAGVSAEFVTGDEGYGRDPLLRNSLQQQGIGYVLAVARNHYTQVTTRLKERADVTEAWLSTQAWQRYSCGPGSKGSRFYDWAWVQLHDSSPGQHSLLIRRSSDGELAFFRCWTPRQTRLVTLIRVAGSRWSVEESFQAAKSQVGLDHYQCRGWKPWHRFTILAMLALAILTAIAVHHTGSTNELIALSVPEIRRLINALILAKPTSAHPILAWSKWRRRHQAQARTSHHQRRHQLELNR